MRLSQHRHPRTVWRLEPASLNVTPSCFISLCHSFLSKALDPICIFNFKDYLEAAVPHSSVQSLSICLVSVSCNRSHLHWVPWGDISQDIVSASHTTEVRYQLNGIKWNSSHPLTSTTRPWLKQAKVAATQLKLTTGAQFEPHNYFSPLTVYRMGLSPQVIGDLNHIPFSNLRCHRVRSLREQRLNSLV